MKKQFIFLFALINVSSIFAQLIDAKSPAELFEFCATQKFIAFGEAHGVGCIPEIELSAVEFQLEKGRTVHFLMEMGRGQELLINKYFFSKSSDKAIFRNSRINFDYIEKLKKLYLKYPQKLFVHGIDAELSLMPFVEELLAATEHIDDARVQKYLDKLVDYETEEIITRKQQNHYRYKIERAVKKLDDYIIYTKSTDTYLKNIVARGVASFYLRKKRHHPKLRDAYLYENVQVLLKQFPADYFYLQAGGNHVFNETEKENYKDGLCYRLQHENNSLIKNNVFSIALGMVDCRSKYWVGSLNTVNFYPIVIDSVVCRALLSLKPTSSMYKIYKPTGENPFDLYLIALNFDAENTEIPKNYLHLLRNK
jgi:hypothetical protein